ncbi:MAG: glycosyltransferase, partial [Pseudobutyrivibrio sp.]|nr:glycosyltransferase [Pseudobutyrivibrio sp.]
MNNKPKTKLLTISLLCCGRADTTERCLKSLMPIRNAIDSELQVVDTGCSPETRAIVEKYADEVFDFEWINDFAAARNFQLDQANGKMLLFIDDDEFFLDCKYIIEFFKQPDCTDYNIGGYYQRNYTDLEGKEYEDIEVVRMCTITPETVFKGKVHEYIEPSYGNAMFMDARAGHYGYVYMTDEDNYNHAMRNIPLLLEMMEEEPDNLRWPYQLGQEYRSIKKFDELYDLCKEAFDHSFDIHEPESIRYRGPFICGMLITLDAQARYDEVIELYNDQINKNDIMDVPKAKMCVYAAKAYFIKGDDTKCEELVDYYFKARERYEEDKGQMFVQGGIFVSDVFDSFHLNTMYCYKMTCAMHRDDLGPLVHYYRRIAWNNHVVRINRGFVHTLAMKAAKYGPKKEITDVLNKFFVRPGLRDIMEKEIEDALPVLNEEQLENIKKAFAKTDGKKEMDMFLDIR